MYGAPRPQTAWQSLPLAAGAQHVEDPIQGLAVVHAGSPAFGLQLGFRQHFLEVRPQGVRRPPVGIHRGIVFLSHDTYLQHRTRYSDRLLAFASVITLFSRRQMYEKHWKLCLLVGRYFDRFSSFF